VLVAVLFICPIGVAALFGFALVADRHFRDSLPAHQDGPDGRGSLGNTPDRPTF
jgi:hypothetical protein